MASRQASAAVDPHLRSRRQADPARQGISLVFDRIGPTAGSWWVDLPSVGYTAIAESHIPRMRKSKFSMLELSGSPDLRLPKSKAHNSLRAYPEAEAA